MAPCYYCKEVFLLDKLTIEHLIALCLGGTNDPNNITLACSPCNNQKGKDAWTKKQQINKEFYEKYHQQYNKQNWQESL